MAGRGKAKSRDDITSLMHVIYCGEDSVPLQKDTELYVESNLQRLPGRLVLTTDSKLATWTSKSKIVRNRRQNNRKLHHFDGISQIRDESCQLPVLSQVIKQAGSSFIPVSSLFLALQEGQKSAGIRSQMQRSPAVILVIHNCAACNSHPHTYVLFR